MLSTLTKVLIGAGVTAAVGAGIAVVAKKTKKVEEKVVIINEDGEREVVMSSEDEKDGIVDRIKEGASRMVQKIFKFVLLHLAEIESATKVIGLVTGIFGIFTAVKDFRQKDELKEQVNSIEKKVDNIMLYQHAAGQATNHNNAVYSTVLNMMCNKLDISNEEIDQALNVIE